MIARPDRLDPAACTGRRIEIRGVVQGVGFRPWVYRLATEHALGGHVRNTVGGVAIEVFGPRETLDMFVCRLEASVPPAAVIRELRWSTIPPVPVNTFSILHSEERADRRVSIPADLPTCSACRSELFDPADRRYR